MRMTLTIGLLALLLSPSYGGGPSLADRLNRFNRYFGEGWGEGYHACAARKRPFRADLPPTPIWLKQRWADPDGGAISPAVPYLRDAPAHSSDWAPAYMREPGATRRPPVPPSVLEEIREYKKELEDKKDLELLDQLEAEEAKDQESPRLSHCIREPVAEAIGERVPSAVIREPLFSTAAPSDLSDAASSSVPALPETTAWKGFIREPLEGESTVARETFLPQARLSERARP